jgi:hypothetical protein
VGLVNLSRSITNAPDLETLIGLGRDVHRLIGQMLAQGASVAQLTQIITMLNDHVTRRVIELSIAEHGAAKVGFTWLAFGSEGRHEQTLKTDQDNGIVFVPPKGSSAAQVREELLPLARVINEALAACGYPLCKGNVMASNPDCCLSVSEWEERFARWIDRGSPEDLLKASIYFDLRRTRCSTSHPSGWCATSWSRPKAHMPTPSISNCVARCRLSMARDCSRWRITSARPTRPRGCAPPPRPGWCRRTRPRPGASPMISSSSCACVAIRRCKRSRNRSTITSIPMSSTSSTGAS